ncbi:unannotated protein [freshwater metagenome]|uniref:Unannotated protein n=1 Tax=freshwater metagenome TaxID=449393 RepID=A0A6J6TRU5_9ZZZZ
MNEAFDAVADLDERTEWNELGDSAVDQLADLMVRCELLPWVLLGCLERQGDSLTVKIDLKHLNVDLITNGDHRAGMIHVLP